MDQNVEFAAEVWAVTGLLDTCFAIAIVCCCGCRWWWAFASRLLIGHRDVAQVVQKTRSDVHAGGGFAVLLNSKPAMLEVDQVSTTGDWWLYVVCSQVVIERGGD